MHGESNVCAAVDVRHHPAVRKISQNHTHTAKALGPSSVPVILAPYGIAATLTGVSYRHNDNKSSGINKLLSDWSTFYPLDKNRSVFYIDISKIVYTFWMSTQKFDIEINLKFISTDIIAKTTVEILLQCQQLWKLLLQEYV